MIRNRFGRIPAISLFVFAVALHLTGCTLRAQDRSLSVFIRFKVTKPGIGKMRVHMGGYRHEGAPWGFPVSKTDLNASEWSEWIDITGWNWHGKMGRAGGIAEFPSIFLMVRDLSLKARVTGAEYEVQLADAPNSGGVVHSFTEKTDGNRIVFLVPFPLRKHRKEFETGRQMAERRKRWAKEILGDESISLEKFELITSFYSDYDPQIAASDSRILRSLGFNAMQGVTASRQAEFGFKSVPKSGVYTPNPAKADKMWERIAKGIDRQRGLENPRFSYDNIAYYEISDEISAMNFNREKQELVDEWFQSYLRKLKLDSSYFGRKIGSVTYPVKTVYKDSLPKDVPLSERVLTYHAAKFGQWWSAKQLRYSTDLIKSKFPDVETGTLLPSHGFLGTAWGPTKIGMTYRMLDIFELAEQQSVDQLSSEDWLGLNHMYGPQYTWTGGQTFGYLTALNRSAIGDRDMLLRGYITPSDEKYLRLKAHTGIGQGIKAIFFWTFGPTIVGTENYWSDLRSQYIGLAKLNRSLQKTEDILVPAKTQPDPVAILYSVSHDIWNNDKFAPFTEKRLLWHALRHLHIQPDFLREEDLIRGRLKDYKVLYISDWNIARAASSAIDSWVKNGGILYLSAGAATRDEFNSPSTPAFSRLVWGGLPAGVPQYKPGTYNERTDLKTAESMGNVTVSLNEKTFKLPVLGARSDLNPSFKSIARYDDGRSAGKVFTYGLGKIIAVGFMPMLAYGKMADFRPTTLAEKWPSEPRELIKWPLKEAGIEPRISADIPVVEVSLLEGGEGAAIVLANYTYEPIKKLRLRVRTDQKYTKIMSSNGESARIVSRSDGELKIETSLEWTDIITLK